jgi:lipopolysaccharide biosynthesis glycosyltransferase
MIDVVFASDLRFIEHVATALASVAANASNPSRMRIWVVVPNDSADHPRVDACRRSGRSLDVRILPVDPGLVADLPASRSITSASYLRLHLPSVLPDEVERYLYLDADVLVESDLEPMASMSTGTRPVAAVIDGYLRRRRLSGMRRESSYFNAGVLLVDRAAWCAADVTARCLRAIGEHRERYDYLDQDALNVALDGDWTPLEARWNQQSVFWERSPRRLGIDPRSLERALDDPVIVHFSGPSKPWEYANVHPFRERYVLYRRLAGLPDRGLAGGSLADIATRATRRVLSLRHRHVVRSLLRKPLRAEDG